MSSLPNPHLVVIGGSLRANSRSRAAAAFAVSTASARGRSAELLDLRELDLPLYAPDNGLNDYAQPHRGGIERLVAACRKATALIWCSPTYHGTVSGLFKNAIDFIELLADDDPPYLTARKIGLIAINDSKTFSAMSNSVHELRAWLAPTHVLLSGGDYDADLSLTSPTGQRRVARLVDEVLS